VRRLIVNADDFGFTAGVNRAIVEAHTHGIVTSSTLMANGNAFEDAVRLAKSVPRLSVGCHVVLTDGEPVLAAKLLPSIISAHSGGPRFHDGLPSFVARALVGRLDPGEIEAEASAQIRKLQSAGLSVSPGYPQTYALVSGRAAASAARCPGLWRARDSQSVRPAPAAEVQ